MPFWCPESTTSTPARASSSGTAIARTDGFSRSTGVPSSHIDVSDPTLLEFEYMRWIAYLMDAHWTRAERLRVLHLGGGGACTMARYVHASFPNSRQVVVEIDGRSPSSCANGSTFRGHVAAHPGRGGAGGTRFAHRRHPRPDRSGRVRDQPHPPAALTTVEFTRHARRVLAPAVSTS